MKNGKRILAAIKNRVPVSQKNTKIARNMQYSNGAWNDSHRK